MSLSVPCIAISVHLGFHVPPRRPFDIEGFAHPGVRSATQPGHRPQLRRINLHAVWLQDRLVDVGILDAAQNDGGRRCGTGGAFGV